MISVRAARIEDADRIAEVHVASWQAAYRDELPADYLASLSGELPARRIRRREQFASLGERERWFVAERDRIVIGFAMLGPARDDVTPGRGELYAIYLEPAAWGQGAGRALMMRALDELRTVGFADAVLWVLESNDRARRFYEIGGWRRDGGAKTEERPGITLREIRYRRAL